MGRNADEDGVVRRLSSFDHEAYTHHLLRLDSASRYLRFGMIVQDEFLLGYAHSCNQWDVVIYGYFVDGVMRGAAELRPLSGTTVSEAEAAFSVETEWRGKGIGSQLFAKLIRAARNRNIRRLHMSCLATNRPMQALARKYEADITFEYGGSVGVVTTHERDLESLMGEAADEMAAFAFASIDLPARTLSDPLGWFNSRG